MARTGRPKKEINKKIFEGLCQIQVTEKEMCHVFECCEDTLNAWCKENYKDEDGNPMTFSDVFKRESDKGLISLRRAQWTAGVVNGNVTMLIWLGKQMLGQSDKTQIDTSDGGASTVYIEGWHGH